MVTKFQSSIRRSNTEKYISLARCPKGSPLLTAPVFPSRHLPLTGFSLVRCLCFLREQYVLTHQYMQRVYIL